MAMPLENVPLDIVPHVCKFLTGFDGFHLSHVNTYWSSYFSDGSFWRERIGEQQSRWSWKKQYVKTRSMLFQGLKVNHRPDDFDSFVYLADDTFRTSRPHFMLAHMGITSFSFDVWFSLLPATKDRHFGGIILGLQSSSRESQQWPHYHQQFAMVSSKGELYCSVLSGKQVVANHLKANRWYHLALSYENNNKQQNVYLNGKEISSVVGPRHHEWYHLRLAQVGTGCVTSDSLHCPYPGHVGWYGFHGVVDAFRVWKGKLSQDDVNVLAIGGEISTIPLSASAKPQQDTFLAKCTRPVEGTTMQFVK
ncbi:hypothetical protein V7S43_009885 [Phytophthora oleae]|uniref:F-box domain-containing protein n=1 Tax=Phytophthora oleae TaxID=2107226 RepID=A0ABD3FH87_9STRA